MVTDLFLSRGLYGDRHWLHFDVHRVSPGWLFIEVASWTLEVSYRSRVANVDQEMRGGI
jgi:hypothetical protein